MTDKKSVTAATGDISVLTTSKPPLTRREMDCVKLLADGLLNKQIGYELGISHKTVERHIASAKEKLSATSAAHLTAIAITSGLISPAPIYRLPPLN